MNNTPLLMFVAFIVVTLGITYWAARRSSGTTAFFAANRQITGWQNGWAVAGDYMSAASFLGIAGLIAFNGYDGFMYSVGFLVAYLTVLFIVAEPLRNSGKFTMADVLAYRLKARPVRTMAALSTLIVSTFYMIAQMIGAGQLVGLFLKDEAGKPLVNYETAVVGVGILMIVYVVFGGMLATTWVQIIKAVLLMSGTILLSILVLGYFGFDIGRFLQAITHVTYTDPATKASVTKNFLEPGGIYKGATGGLDLFSLGLALVLGTAGLPHILVRFYTVPSAKVARTSIIWAMALIGLFYILTTFLGWGAATIVGRDAIAKNGGSNMSAPLLAQSLGGDIFFAFISSVAFATILAVVAGLTISASTSFSHDFWTNVVHGGKERSKGQEVMVARIAAFGVGIVAILLAILLKNLNVAFLVGLAFAVAASANLPVIIFSLFWKRFTTTGAVLGIATGLISSLVLITISPSIMTIDPETVTGAARHLIQAQPIFPLANPGIVSIPLGFLGAVVGTLMSREPSSEARFTELEVRANTGLGAEV
ncbi:MAG: cation/acetate symporter [Chloroflexia bacterium]|nr:cation/acetate symporter [Chloroflexia bacterium]